MQLIAQIVDRRPEVRDFETDDQIGSAYGSTRALRVIQRMQRWEIHSAALVDDRRLQYLGQFNEHRHRSRRSCKPISDEDWIFSSNEKARELGDGGGFALRRRVQGQLRNLELAFGLDRP